MVLQKLRVHTLCYKNKFTVPKAMRTKFSTVAEVRSWIANKLHFPVCEATLIAGGIKLEDATLVSDLVGRGIDNIHLVCSKPPPGSNVEKIVVYVKDTSRIPNKTYAVKMDPSQTPEELKLKLYEKSSCKLRPRQQLLTCRGKIVDNTFSLREYTISQRSDRILFYLSKNPNSIEDEDLNIVVTVPSNNAKIKETLRANQTVQNLRQLLQRSHGIRSEKYSLLNAAGLVLQDNMALRIACTMPTQRGGGLGPLPGREPGSLNLNLFAVPIPADKLSNGSGFHVYLNAEHHAPLGIVDTALMTPSSTTGRTKKRRKQSKSSTCATQTNALQGFRGLFRKKKSSKTTTATAQAQANTDKPLHDKKNKAKVKSGPSSYRRRIKAMMKKSRYASNEEKLEQYRKQIGRNVGGGVYRRIDSI